MPNEFNVISFIKRGEEISPCFSDVEERFKTKISIYFLPDCALELNPGEHFPQGIGMNQVLQVTANNILFNMKPHDTDRVFYLIKALLIENSTQFMLYLGNRLGVDNIRIPVTMIQHILASMTVVNCTERNKNLPPVLANHDYLYTNYLKASQSRMLQCFPVKAFVRKANLDERISSLERQVLNRHPYADDQASRTLRGTVKDPNPTIGSLYVKSHYRIDKLQGNVTRSQEDLSRNIALFKRTYAERDMLTQQIYNTCKQLEVLLGQLAKSSTTYKNMRSFIIKQRAHLAKVEQLKSNSNQHITGDRRFRGAPEGGAITQYQREEKRLNQEIGKVSMELMHSPIESDQIKQELFKVLETGADQYFQMLQLNTNLKKSKLDQFNNKFSHCVEIVTNFGNITTYRAKVIFDETNGSIRTLQDMINHSLDNCSKVSTFGRSGRAHNLLTKQLSSYTMYNARLAHGEFKLGDTINIPEPILKADEDRLLLKRNLFTRFEELLISRSLELTRIYKDGKRNFRQYEAELLTYRTQSQTFIDQLTRLDVFINLADREYYELLKVEATREISKSQKGGGGGARVGGGPAIAQADMSRPIAREGRATIAELVANNDRADLVRRVRDKFPEVYSANAIWIDKLDIQKFATASGLWGEMAPKCLTHIWAHQLGGLLKLVSQTRSVVTNLNSGFLSGKESKYKAKQLVDGLAMARNEINHTIMANDMDANERSLCCKWYDLMYQKLALHRKSSPEAKMTSSLTAINVVMKEIGLQDYTVTCSIADRTTVAKRTWV
jgi:hypothetical protein